MKIIDFFRSVMPPKAVVSGGLMASFAYAATSALHRYAHVDVPADIVAAFFGTVAGYAYHVIPDAVQTKVDAFDTVVRTVGPAVVDAVGPATR